MKITERQQVKRPVDSLDIHHEEFNRSRHFQNQQPIEEVVYKNFYKQQLDDLIQQKNQHRSLQKQIQQQQRRIYNERLRLGNEAQRIKEISYKNYYQMIMNNQQNFKNKYVSPFQERDQEKDKLISRGVQVGKIKSQNDYERQIKRQQSMKKQFQTVLSHQMNQKEENSKKQIEEKLKANQYLKNVLLSPQQVEKIQRERKLGQMYKYKEDLDKIKHDKYNLTKSHVYNPQSSPSKTNLGSHRHNILLNPVPFNIQNPYIIKQMQRKSMLYSTQSYQTIPDHNANPNPYFTKTKNNIFG